MTQPKLIIIVLKNTFSRTQFNVMSKIYLFNFIVCVKVELNFFNYLYLKLIYI